MFMLAILAINDSINLVFAILLLIALNLFHGYIFALNLVVLMLLSFL